MIAVWSGEAVDLSRESLRQESGTLQLVIAFAALAQWIQNPTSPRDHTYDLLHR